MEIKIKIAWLLLRVSLLFYLYQKHQVGVDAIKNKFEDEILGFESNNNGLVSQFLDRLTQVEDKSREHEKDIAYWKSTTQENRQLVNDLIGRVVWLEAIVKNHMIPASTEILGRRERPARLMPLSILLGKPSNTTVQDEPRFYGPPTNCSDLGKLGYTLNGYYLVKSKQGQSNNSSQSEVMFCKFKHEIMKRKQFILETLIGKIGIKTTAVHFYVQRNNSFTESNAIIPFQLEVLNMGKAMNVSSGIFTAPVGGIYNFEFCGSKDNSEMQLVVLMEVNGVHAGTAQASGLKPMSLNINLAVSLRLKLGDRVNLYKSSGILFDSSSHFTHFRGRLVEEDLVSS